MQERMTPDLQPTITRNCDHVFSTGRYKITIDRWGAWAFTLRGARRAARRLKRKYDLHGTVVDAGTEPRA
jgi:hypothetical protein